MIELTQARARRAQQVTILYAVMACLALLVGVQWILLSVAVDGFLGARHDVLGASTAASGVCFVAACWLLRRVPGRGTEEPLAATETTGRQDRG